MVSFATRRRVMVDTQVRPSDVTEFPIIEAMLTIPREAYVPRDKVEAAYISDHIDLGQGRFLLDPRLFAKMLDALNLSRGDFVLDLGCGLGYSSAVVARMVDAVVAVEEDDTLYAEAEATLAEQNADNVILHHGPLSDGAPVHGPYDAILLQGGVEKMPQSLCDQLKEGGRIVVIFLEGRLGTVKVGHKSNGQISWRFAFNGTAPLLPGFEQETEFAL